MSRHPERNPEIRHEDDLPLFSEQSFTKFEQQKSGRTDIPSAGENGDCRSLRDAQSSSSSPRDVVRARRNDPATSYKAAASVTLTNLGRTKDRILQALRNVGPMTDEQIAAHFERFVTFKVSPSGLRTRRSWLVGHGFVTACGTGKTTSGRDCQIWKAK